MIKKILLLLVTGFCILSLNACSTIEGAGKDLQKVGHAIEKKAKRS